MKAKNANKSYYSVTALADTLGLDESQVNYYERRGLVSSLISKQNGRLFSACEKARLRLITRAKDAGYSIGKIESLIGRISPHLSETAKVKESIDIAVKNLKQMRNDQAESDVLEQINIACDLKLLGDYLKELNALRLEPHVPNKKKQRVPDKPQQPDKDRARHVVEIPIDSIPSIVDVFGKKTTGISKKYLFASMFLGLLAVIGFIFLFYKPGSVPEGISNRQIDNPTLTSNADTVDSGRTNTKLPESTEGNTLNIQKEDDGEEPALSLSLLSESNNVIPHSDEFSGEEGIVPDQTLDHDPSPMALKDENPLQPMETDPHAIGSEKASSELIDKLIKDMQSKYDSPPTATTAPRKDLSQTNSENDELKAVADVTASLALVQNAKKSVPSNAAKETSEPVSSKKPNASEKPSGIKDPPKTAAKTNPDEKPPLKASSSKKASAKKVEINEKVPASSHKKERVQPKQALKDKSKQTQPRKQKTTPVKKLKPEKTKTEAPASPKKKLETIDPAALDWAKKSRESFQKGDISETIVSATVSISIEPQQVQPYIDRALAYKKKGLFEKAIADCNRAMVNDPGSAIAVYTRGTVYQAMGQKQNARIDYAKACVMGFVDGCDIQTAQLEKDSVDTLMKQSRESFRKGDWDAVILATTDVLKQDPANVIAYVTRSAAYSQKKMFMVAISDCDAALKIDPVYALAYNNRGYAQEQLKKTDEARQDYEKACDLGLKLGCKNYEKF
ncbi:MAG: MerR family transcriptional regulator [Thermodesulfobacteriota bacterium]